MIPIMTQNRIDNPTNLKLPKTQQTQIENCSGQLMKTQLVSSLQILKIPKKLKSNKISVLITEKVKLKKRRKRSNGCGSLFRHSRVELRAVVVEKVASIVK